MYLKCIKADIAIKIIVRIIMSIIDPLKNETRRTEAYTGMNTSRNGLTSHCKNYSIVCVAQTYVFYVVFLYSCVCFCLLSFFCFFLSWQCQFIFDLLISLNVSMLSLASLLEHCYVIKSYRLRFLA